jgi:hypothetical protein
MIALDSTNKLYMFMIDTANNVVNNLKISAPISLLSPFSVSGTYAQAVKAAPNWDFFIAGKGTSFDFSGLT